MGVHLVTIVYLSANPKYRAFVERCIEFLERVYKDEVLADLELVAYSKYDKRDLEEARRLGIPIDGSHYHIMAKRAVIAENHGARAIDVFTVVVEEVSHHALRGAHNVERAIGALVKDVPRLKTVIKRSRVDESDRTGLYAYINELYSKYAVYNYFVKLYTKPVLTPGTLETLVEFIDVYGEMINILASLAKILNVSASDRDEENVMPSVTRIMYDEVVKNRNPLLNFGEAVHAIFTEVIKRFPAEVYNSDLSRYGVLYMKQPIQGLPL
jgi:hypothetical protein